MATKKTTDTTTEAAEKSVAAKPTKAASKSTKTTTAKTSTKAKAEAKPVKVMVKASKAASTKSAAKPAVEKSDAEETKTVVKSATTKSKVKRPANHYYGTGRRKSSIARVFIKSGMSAIVVNGVALDQYFGRETDRMVVRQPLEAVKMLNHFAIMITVRGGGTSGQAGAIRHGLSRALVAYDESGNTDVSEPNENSFRHILRVAGYLTRDPRAVERKKVGLHGARKRPQYSKR